MSKDVLITPASGIIEFYENAGNLEASIELDNSNNLVITGNVTLGDAGADVIIGDGVSAANVIFEQGGAVYGLATKTLTLGIAGSFLSLAANITSGANITGNVTGGNMISLGSLSTVGTATIGAFTLPNTDGTPGQTLTTYGNGVVHWSTSGGSVSGTFNVFARSGAIAISIIAGFFDVGTRNSGTLKVAVS